MARLTTHVGRDQRVRFSTGDEPDYLFGPGPFTAPSSPSSTPPPRHSGGTSGDLTIPHYQPQTPTETYVPSEPSHVPGVGGRPASAPRGTAATTPPVSLVDLSGGGAHPGKGAGGLVSLASPIISALDPIVSPLIADVAKPLALEKKTVGNEDLAEILDAAKSGGLKLNQAGRLTTPPVRAALQGVSQARQFYRQTAHPDLSGLSPAERAVYPYVAQAHREYPGIPRSVNYAQIRQESGFQPINPSSAGAEGLTQFIPGTAAEYGVHYGASPAAQQSQVTGEDAYLHSLGFEHDPQAALSAYSGGYAASAYNNPILESARTDYAALDQSSRPSAQAISRFRQAAGQARQLGLKVSGPTAPGPGAGSQKVKNPPYVYPFPANAWEPERVDQGKDFGPKREGAPILAIGRGRVLKTGAPGWPGEGGVLYELSRGPKKGNDVFAYESLNPTVSAGDVVRPGEIIGRGVVGGTGVESGWADSAGVPISHGEYSEGMETRGGKAFAGFLSNLAAGRPVGPGVVTGVGGVGAGTYVGSGTPVGPAGVGSSVAAASQAAPQAHPAVSLIPLQAPAFSAGPTLPTAPGTQTAEEELAELLAAEGLGTGRRSLPGYA